MRPEAALDQFFSERNLVWLGLRGDDALAYLVEKVTPKFWDDVAAQGLRLRKRGLLKARQDRQRMTAAARQERQRLRKLQGGARRELVEEDAFVDLQAERHAKFEAALEQVLRTSEARFLNTRRLGMAMAPVLGRSPDYLRRPLKEIAKAGSKYYDARLDRWRYPREAGA